MKAILKKFWLYLPIAMLFGAVGCSDDKDPVVVADPASITIDNVTTTSSSVKFTLTPENAVRYTYEVALVGETGTAQEIANGEASTQEVNDLEADKLYFIKAVAYNTDGEPSEEARHEFRTTALASVAIQETIEVTISSAKVTFVPTNATSVSYTWYETANKPAELQWTKVEGNETFTAEITELKDDTDYTVEAFAANAEGDSESQIATFKTLALPTLTMALNAEEVTAHSAKVTFTPANAEGFAYAYYKAEERPEEPVFVPVSATEETVVTLNRLAANTAYMVEAYAWSGDYTTEIITLEEAFTTPESAEGIEVNIINNGKVAYAEIYMDPEKVTSYHYSEQFIEVGGWLDYDSPEAWWKDEQDNAWWGLSEYKVDKSMMSAGLMLNKEYKFYIIAKVNGAWDTTTLKEYSFTTGTGFDFDADAAPEVTCTPALTTIPFDVACSGNSTIVLSCCAPKATVDATEGGAEAYFASTNMYVSRMIDVPFVNLEHTGLLPRTEYCVMTATLERDGKFSPLDVQTITTLAVEPVEGVKTTVELAGVSFTSAEFNVAVEYAEEEISQLRYKFVKKVEAGDDEEMADQIYGASNTMTAYPSKSDDAENTYTVKVVAPSYPRLESGVEYVVYMAPVLSGERFGEVVSYEFKTDSVGDLDGTATVEMEGGFNLDKGYMQVTFKPSDDCTTILYKSVDASTFTTNRFNVLPNKLAENIVNDTYSVKTIYDPSDESLLTDASFYYSLNSSADLYVIALIKDGEGRFKTAYAQLKSSWFVTDSDLRNVLKEYDTDGDGALYQSEIEAVTSLTLSDKTYTNMRGLSYLSALETLEMKNVTGGEWLFESTQQYRTWENPMPALKTLKITNEEGKQLSFTHIGLHLCPELETLRIDAWLEYSSLKKLDISENKKLLIDSDNFYIPYSVAELVCNADQEAKVKSLFAERIYDGELKLTVAE